MIWQISLICIPNKLEKEQQRHLSLLDIEDFQYVYNNEQLCASSQLNSKLLIVLVHSARQNGLSRNKIRQTWGQVQRYFDWDIRLVFLLGMENPLDPDLQIYQADLNSIKTSIEAEVKDYNDIVMGNFRDAYRNMTYKSMMGYKWILEYCSNADFLLRVDDDMFVDIFQVIDYISSKLDAESDSFYCYIMRDRSPERGNDSKWSVTKTEYEPDVYPSYCLGAGYLANIGVVPKVYSVSNQVQFFWIDDIFIGILSEYYNSRMLSNSSLQSAITMEDLESKYEFYKWNNTERNWERYNWMLILIDRMSIMYGAMDRLYQMAFNSTIRNYSLESESGK